MDDLRFLEGTYEDLTAAHGHCCDIWNAIESLQGTELWRTLPLETRRALSAAHAHAGALEGVLSHIV
jgi:hypothetical protein